MKIKAMNQENLNLILAVVLSILVFAGWHYFYDVPKQEKATSQQTAPSEKSSPSLSDDLIQPQVSVKQERSTVLSQGERIAISSDKLKGSIRLMGGRFDDLTLEHYTTSLDKGSPEVVLLSPANTTEPYFADFGWVSTSKTVELPTASTPWQTDKTSLRANETITLSWTNSQGLTFKRTIHLDEHYLFTITQSATNNGTQPMELSPFGLISREGTPKTSGYMILHEGPLGYLEGKLKEIKYADLQTDHKITQNSTGGWLGITDKYWLTALVPEQSRHVKTAFRDTPQGSIDHYQVDVLETQQAIQPGETLSVKTHFFAGAKKLEILDKYEEELNCQHFDLAVDFGWFYFITKPMFYMLTFFNSWIGNFGISILLLTVLIKIAFLPLANKSYRSMAKMKALQPDIKKVQERYKDDKLKSNQEIMALYKKNKANPVSGCLPMIIQIPVFFSIYKVLYVTIEMRQAPFFGWIQDLSVPDPSTFFNLFGLIPWDPPNMLMIGAWPLIMGASMLLQQKMNPPPADPMQAKMFMLMPIVFTIMLAGFPAGLVIYWTWNNILSIGQQWTIQRLSEKK